MFDIKFKIERKGCWTCDLSRKYKGKFVSHTTFRLSKGTTSDIVHINQIINFIKKHKIVYKVDIMFEDEDNLYLQVFSNVSKIKSLIGTINNNGGFLLRPILLEKGYEVCNITVPNKENLNKLINELKKLGKFTLLSIKKSNLDNSDLSRKQKLVIDLAFKLGYYEFPRKISATQIANRLKISKSTLLQHLRSAEIKVLKNSYLP
jgi:predicted DNA binding protein